jgi:hypothetical protein
MKIGLITNPDRKVSTKSYSRFLNALLFWNNDLTNEMLKFVSVEDYEQVRYLKPAIFFDERGNKRFGHESATRYQFKTVERFRMQKMSDQNWTKTVKTVKPQGSNLDRLMIDLKRIDKQIKKRTIRNSED